MAKAKTIPSAPDGFIGPFQLNAGEACSAIVQKDGKSIVLTLDLDGEQEESDSGKMMMLASTHGFAMIPGTNCRISLNVGLPNPRYVKG